MNYEQPNKRFSALPSELKASGGSDVEKARRRRLDREGVKDESISQFEEKLKRANEKLRVSNPILETEESHEAEDVTEVAVTLESSIRSFLERFDRLSEEVKLLEDSNDEFNEIKGDILNELKVFAERKIGINSQQEMDLLEDTLISKLKERTRRFDNAA